MSKPSRKKSKQSSSKKDKSKRLVEQGVVFHKSRQIQLAEDCYRRAVELDPLNFRALYLIGTLFAEVGNFKDAAEFMRLAIKVNPGYSLSYNDLGVVLQQMGDVKGAMENYKKALELNGKFHEAQNNLGVAEQSRGNAAKAREYFKNAMAINPYYVDASSNYIFALDLCNDETVDSLIQARKDWAAIHEAPYLNKPVEFKNSLTTDRKIRVGYFSADFRFHSASFCFGTMITNFNRDKFEIYCYNNSHVAPDMRTNLFKENATVWRDVYGMSDDDLTKLARKDELDIAIDLSGFSAGSRIMCFCRRVAPVQACGWGYATSTGLQAMDYFLADDVIVPESEKSKYVEEVLYLPAVINYFCPEISNEVGELPALTQGVITFGSFNRVAKISDETFATWGRLMAEIPNSRFVFKINEEDPNTTKNRIVDIMMSHGVAGNRLWFAGKTSLKEHLKAFNTIDIHLDSWSHSGGLTSADCLLSGVPVLTYAHPTIVGRLTSSFLHRMGMDDWIASSPEEYIKIAKEKCSDLQALSELRKGLRERFLKSPMGDQVAYCRDTEKLYLKMWVDYVESKTT